jgi:hypothetical protein
MASLNLLKQLTDKIYDLKDELAELSKVEKQVRAEKAKVEAEVIKLLNEEGLDSFNGTKARVKIRLDEYPSVPKDEEAKREFFLYLRERGVYWEMATVNAAQFKKFWKEEKEANNGELEIPGIDGPFVKMSLSVTKHK